MRYEKVQKITYTEVLKCCCDKMQYYYDNKLIDISPIPNTENFWVSLLFSDIVKIQKKRSSDIKYCPFCGKEINARKEVR